MRKRFLSCVAPALVGLLFVQLALALSGVREKAATMDEPVHISGGYLYWRHCDFRVNPENGNLPQRVAALPHIFGSIPELTPEESKKWQASEQWLIASAFYNHPEVRREDRIFSSRIAMATLVMLPVSLVIFFWSRELWGTGGAFFSLSLAVTSPTMLAHGPLATSDMCFAGTFALSLWLFWKTLLQPRWILAIALGVAIGAMAVSKHTFLIFPICALPMIVIAIVLNGRDGGWWRRVLIGLTASSCISFILIWAAYCFRFSGFGFDAENSSYFVALETLIEADPRKHAVLNGLAKMHLLPEAMLYGIGHVFAYASERSAFLAGSYYVGGNVWFFPLALVMKTSLPILVSFILALYVVSRACLLGEGRDMRLWATPPLVIGVVVTLGVCIASQLNIGHRHLLPAYPLLFVLAGAVVSLGGRWGHYIAAIAATFSLVVALGAFPNYLSFFNSLAGGPNQGWRYFTDSTVDWGQDLPIIEEYVSSQIDEDENAFVAYFGPGESDFLYERAEILRHEGYPYPGWRTASRISGGTFVFSATAMVAPYLGLRRPWSESHENALWELSVTLESELKNVTLQSVASLSDAERARLSTDLRLFYRLRYEKLRLFFIKRPVFARPSPVVFVFHASEDELAKIVPLNSVVPEDVDVGELMMTLDSDIAFFDR